MLFFFLSLPITIGNKKDKKALLFSIHVIKKKIINNNNDLSVTIASKVKETNKQMEYQTKKKKSYLSGTKSPLRTFGTHHSTA